MPIDSPCQQLCHQLLMGLPHKPRQGDVALDMQLSVLLILPPFIWAAWYITRLLVELTPKGVVFSCLCS